MIETVSYGDITLAVCPIAHSDSDRHKDQNKAVRNLLDASLGTGCRLAHREDGSPYIDGSGLSISISHSRDYACITFSPSLTVGVDIEQPRTQLRRVAPRVLSDSELAVYGASDSLLLRAWTLKEALYKAALTPGLDFRRDIMLPADAAGTQAEVLGHPYDVIAVIERSDSTIALVSRRLTA